MFLTEAITLATALGSLILLGCEMGILGRELGRPPIPEDRSVSSEGFGLSACSVDTAFTLLSLAASLSVEKLRKAVGFLDG